MIKSFICRLLLKPRMGQNNGKKFYPVSPTKIRNCVWIKLAHRAKTTVMIKLLLGLWFDCAS